MEPIVGKPRIERTLTQKGYMYLWQIRDRSAQKAPYNLPAYYLNIYSDCMSNTMTESQTHGLPFNAQQLWLQFIDSGLESELKAKSYERLKGLTYNKVEAGLNFVEARQSIDMIKRHSVTLLNVYRDIRKFRFGDAAKRLKMNFVPPGVSKKRAAASNFLEYHFGWKPLLGDIHDALETYRDPVKYLDFHKASASASKSWQVNRYYGATQDWNEFFGTWTIRQGLAVRAITDRDALTLEQWGVANPLALAWEAIPFSFVVDWFVNVGQCLSASSDYAGLQLERTYHSLHVRGQGKGEGGLTGTDPNPPGYPPCKWKGSLVWFGRYPGLQGPTLQLSGVGLPPVSRALAAVSLLVQQFSKR